MRSRILILTYMVGDILPGIKYILTGEQRVTRLTFNTNTIIIGDHGEIEVTEAVCHYLRDNGYKETPLNEYSDEFNNYYYRLERLPKLAMNNKIKGVTVEYSVSVGSGELIFTLIMNGEV